MIKLLLSLFTLLLSCSAWAYDAEIDGIYYNLNSETKKATVTFKEKDYNSYSGDVIIPYSVNYSDVSYSVTNIGNRAFADCTGLTSITFPNSVTNIGMNAFSGCTAMTSIMIPNSVTSIGAWAFRGCAGLTSIEIPNSVMSIGVSAFSGCTGLTSIEIPNSVTSMAANAFIGCTDLSSVTVNSNTVVSPKYKSSSNLGNIFGSQVKKYILGEDVTSIGDYAFYGCTGMISIEIPNSVTSIGSNVFSGCTGLTSINIPNSIINIGGNAFSGCTGLTSVKINSGAIVSKDYGYDKSSQSFISLRNIFGEQVTEYVIGNEVTSIGADAFYQCTNLTSITISNSVTSIGSSAFSGCYGLTSIKIPNSVTSIGSSAFSGCSGLTSIMIPNSVTKIGGGVFSYCPGLTSIKVSDDNHVYDSRNNCNAIIETASNTLISGCQNTVIHNNVTRIGKCAFEGCAGLTSIEIPNSVTSIDGYAFDFCYDLTSVDIPNSVTNIGMNAFSGCTAMTSIMIPNSVTSIDGYAFQRCKSLTSIEIPNSVTSIEDGTFNACTGLTSVDIPNSVKSIGNHAFLFCPSLAYVTIGNNVKSIGSEAFSGCTGLTSVTCDATTPPTMGSNVFSKVDKSACTLYVPAESMWTYASTDQWKDFLAIKERPISVDGIYYYLNSNAKEARVTAGARKYSGSVTIPSSITYSSVTYNVTSINDGTFSGCDDLTSVTINNNSIVSATYSFSSNLGNIFGKQVEQYILGDEVTTIGANAFNSCTALKNISIGSGIENVGSKAFANCRKLEDVYCYVVRYPMTDDDIFENSYIEFATLHVPNKSINQYKNKVPWSGFMEVVGIDDMTGINNIEDSKENNIRTYYDTNGRILSAPQKGMNIVKKANGQTIKVFVK